MAKERIRNQVTENRVDAERIAQEEAQCWAEYDAQKKAEEERVRLQYEKDMAAYNAGILQGEDSQEEDGVEKDVSKDRTKRSSRRRSTKRKNKTLQKNADMASKSLRKKTSEVETEGHQGGKAAKAVKRSESLVRSAEKRGLI